MKFSYNQCQSDSKFIIQVVHRAGYTRMTENEDLNEAIGNVGHDVPAGSAEPIQQLNNDHLAEI